MIRQEYELNLIPYVSPLVKVNVSQYDRGSRELAFKFVKGETPFSIPSDASVKIQGLKGDDNAFEYAMTVSGNEAVIALQEQMTAVAGQVVCQIVLTKEDGSLLGTANFMLSVEPSPIDEDAITSETDIPILNTLTNGGDKPGQVIEWDGEKADWADPVYARWGELKGNIEDQTDLKDALDAKVDTESGKGLSSNDYTTEEKNKLSSLPTSEEITTALGNKVDKVEGMGLSENSYTTAEKTKLSNLPTSSELEQDLAEKVDKVEGKGLSANDYSNADKGKLDALPTNSELIDTLANKADLGSDGKVPASQLPSYVDDVLEYATLSAFPATGESGKIYVALDTGKTYRWSGSTYTEISESLALGETADTAYAGNKGKATTDALNVHLEDNVRHITNAERTSWNNKVDSETGKGLSSNDFTTAEKEKLAGIEVGAQVNTLTGVKGDAEATYRTGNVNITKDNIGLGNVDNTSDLNKPISTAVQNELTALNNNLSQKITNPSGGTVGQVLKKTATGEEWADESGGGGGGATWGQIGGTLSNQTDLQNALDAKANVSAVNSLAGSIAVVETSPATANHAVGDLIVFNNQLYKVTVAIASGEATVVGTNVQADSVADEIEALGTYSTTETVVGRWIDGKPVYRKVIVKTSGFGNGRTIENLSTLDTLLTIRGSMLRSNGVTIPVEHTHHSDLSVAVSIFISADKNLAIEYGNGINPTKLILILDYTKTTD